MGFFDFFKWVLTGEVTTKLEKLSLSAGKGNVVAQLKLGLCYLEGDGVPVDNREAVKWFFVAAKRGSVRAQSHLGRALVSRKGVPLDYEAAYAWLNIAETQGDKDAVEWRSEIIPKMTPEQIEAGDILSQELSRGFGGSK